jgi:hypothetical protein
MPRIHHGDVAGVLCWKMDRPPGITSTPDKRSRPIAAIPLSRAFLSRDANGQHRHARWHAARLPAFELARRISNARSV